MIAALFVHKGGAYYGLPDVDPWDEERDARLYAGPWPVVAHPPCERWGRYAAAGGRTKGHDNGCFASALASVERWGGVLEHPEGSSAWPLHGLARPPRGGGWIVSRFGWTCCVEQRHYGHRARKATWLYAVGVAPPALRWGKSIAEATPAKSLESAKARGVRPSRVGIIAVMSKTQRAATPSAFRDLLLDLARATERCPYCDRTQNQPRCCLNLWHGDLRWLHPWERAPTPSQEDQP